MKRILLVDDDVDALETLAELLCEEYEVVTAVNGAEAVFATTRHAIDAIVLDLKMPVLDGAGVVEELRTRGLRIPVILVSACLDLGAVSRSLGVDGYVGKPFDVAILERKLAALGTEGVPLASGPRSVQQPAGGDEPTV
jgi:CheY-like chemotaxis protein